MPIITVPEDTYLRLSLRAEALGTSPDALAVPALERAAAEAAPLTPSGELPFDEWKRLLDGLTAAARARADRYPPGFQADVSRQAMYEGCGE